MPAKRNNKQRGARRHGGPPAGVTRGRWFLAGLGTGVSLCLALYLLGLPEDKPPAETPEPVPEDTEAQPRFHFYELLPEQRIELDVEPEEAAAARNPPGSGAYLLQAGSFRQREDADRRRAELLLLGLEPRVEEATSDRGTWFRVYIGPFESRSRLARARSLTAEQGIDTLLLKRASP